MASGLVEGGFISEPQDEQPQKTNGLSSRPTAEPSILAHLSEEEVVFRGGKTYSLEYVPRMTLVFQRRSAENLRSFPRAGFLVILPFAKSVEHLRLLYLGSSENTFKNEAVKGALKSLEVCLESGDFESLSHSGFTGKAALYPHMDKQTLVAENPRSLKRVIRQMIHLSFKLYGKGNKYRHNAVKPWAEVSEEYQQASQLAE